MAGVSPLPAIEVARHAGVCYGVERACDLAKQAARSSGSQGDGSDESRAGASQAVSTLGPLIHNPLVVAELESMGVGVADTVDDAPDGTLIIRAHGVVPEAIERARARGLRVLDATCPYVKKVHVAAERLVSEGYQLIVIGESGHPEVEGIVGHSGGRATVVSSASDVDGIELEQRVGVVVQTTQTARNLSEVVSAIMPRVREVRVMNTICKATQERQDSAIELASRADVMIVVGGKNSGNTRRLAELCRASCPRTHHIEDAAEVEAAWFASAKLIGITAGASTPGSHIDRARAAIESAVGLR